VFLTELYLTVDDFSFKALNRYFLIIFSSNKIPFAGISRISIPTDSSSFTSRCRAVSKVSLVYTGPPGKSQVSTSFGLFLL
jgi:hypothetical protein